MAADLPISALSGSFSTYSANNLFVIVDIADVSMAATGTDKKITVASFLSNYNVITVPGSTTITTLGTVTTGTWQATTIAAAYLTALAASGTNHSAGIAPDPGASAGTTRFLREDATWTADHSTSTVTTSGGTARSLVTRYSEVINVKDYGAKGDGSTDDTTALQAAFTAATAGAVIYFPPATYNISSTLTLSVAVTINGYGATISQTATGHGGISSASSLAVYGLSLVGAQYATANSYEKAINVVGSSAASPAVGITIVNCSISSWGYAAIYLWYCNDLTINGNTINNINYGGIMCLSCIDGTIVNNVITNVTGTSYVDAYGVILSRNATSSLTTDPRSSDISVIGNKISNVTIWEGLDTHGGQRISFIGNSVYNCVNGIVATPCPNGSGTYTYAPLDITISGNTIDSAVTNGSKSYGIMLAGASSGLNSVVQFATGTIKGNTIRGCGSGTSGGAGAINLQATSGASVTGNVMIAPAACGVCVYHDNFGFAVVGNTTIDPWCNSSGVGYAVAINVYEDYNTGTISQNSSYTTGTVSATYLLSQDVRVIGGANSAVYWTSGYTTSSNPVYDPNSTLQQARINSLSIGSVSSPSNMLYVRNDQNAATPMALANLSSGASASAQFLVYSNTASGYLGAFSSNCSTTRRKNAISYSLNSGAAALLFEANASSSQIIQFWPATTSGYGMQLDSSGAKFGDQAGNTVATISLAGLGTFANVTIGSISGVLKGTSGVVSAATANTDYVLPTGVSGGQTITGGTASGDTLKLVSTSNATLGKVLFGSNSAYDEVNTRIGVGTQSPSYTLHAYTASGGADFYSNSGSSSPVQFLAGASNSYVGGRVGTLSTHTLWFLTSGSARASINSSGQFAITNAPLKLASNYITFGSAAPSSGTWVAGDICYNTGVASGQPEGWRCTSGGTPGTWSAMANH